MLQTHKNNIPGIKAAVAHFGKIYFHGDGNIYHKKEDSDFRKDFGNDRDGANTYRIEFNKDSKIPETVEELNKALLNAKTKEVVESHQQKELSTIPTFKVEIEPEADATDAKGQAAADKAAKAAEAKAQKEADAKAAADKAAGK